MIFKQIHKQLKVHTLLILYISHVQRQATIKLKQLSKFISKILIMQFSEDSYSNAKYENS